MKQIRIFLLAIVSLLATSSVMADRMIPVSQLPAAVTSFVNSYFSGKRIIYAEKEHGNYECHLNDGTKVEVDKKGNWEKVDGNRMTAVPDALVPERISEYVKANFPEFFISKIDKERYGYEIELSNDIDLKFNRQFELIGMGD